MSGEKCEELMEFDVEQNSEAATEGSGDRIGLKNRRFAKITAESSPVSTPFSK